jgi:hypothetical protein
MMAVVDILGPVGASLATVAAAYSLRSLIDALRASKALKDRIATDPKERELLCKILTDLQSQRDESQYKEAIDEAIKLIETQIESLPEDQRKEVLEGLHQSSKQGQLAFITKMVKASATGR